MSSTTPIGYDEREVAGYESAPQARGYVEHTPTVRWYLPPIHRVRFGPVQCGRGARDSQSVSHRYGCRGTDGGQRVGAADLRDWQRRAASAVDPRRDMAA